MEKVNNLTISQNQTMDLLNKHELNSRSSELRPATNAIISTTDVDWSLKHFFILLVLGISAAVWFGTALKNFNALPVSGALITVSISAIALFLVAVFQIFLIKSFSLNLVVAAAEAVAIGLMIPGGFSRLGATGLLLFVGSLLLAYHRGRQELTDHLKINFHRFGAIVIRTVASGLAIFLALLYAGLYQTTKGISYDAFRFITSGTMPVVRSFVPGFSPEMAATGFFKTFAASQVNKMPQVAKLSEAEKQEVFEEFGSQLKTRFEELTKTMVASGESALSYFYRVANQYLGNFADGLAFVPMVVIGLIIFFIIRGVMFFVKWPVAWISYLVYRLLLVIGVIYLGVEPRNKEIIMVK